MTRACVEAEYLESSPNGLLRHAVVRELRQDVDAALVRVTGVGPPLLELTADLPPDAGVKVRGQARPAARGLTP